MNIVPNACVGNIIISVGGLLSTIDLLLAFRKFGDSVRALHNWTPPKFPTITCTCKSIQPFYSWFLAPFLMLAEAHAT